MAKFDSKVNGNSVAASEYNNLATGLKNLIENSGQTIDATNTQISKAAANYAAVSTYYTDSGSANAYVLSPIGNFESPDAYYDGMEIRFRADNANSGASTVNVNSLGDKTIKLQDKATDLGAGDISADKDSIARYDDASGFFILLTAGSSFNAIINGDMNIWQRGTSFTSVGFGDYTADRFRYQKAGAMVHDVDQSSDVPTVAQSGKLYNYSLLVDCTTTDASIGASDNAGILQAIEGYNWAKLAQKPFVLSFWVKATKTGTYCVGFINDGTDRSYVAEYTVDATNTWEKKTITVSASPSAGTWNYTNGTGLDLVFTLAAGSTFQTTAGSWQTGNFIATSNQVNACDSTSNNFRITGIELGSSSNVRDRTYDEELDLCQRYFIRYNEGGSGDYTAIGQIQQSTLAQLSIFLPKQMRVAPTLTFSAGTFEVFVNSDVKAISSVNGLQGNRKTLRLAFNIATATPGEACHLRGQGGSGYIDVEAEL